MNRRLALLVCIVLLLGGCMSAEAGDASPILQQPPAPSPDRQEDLVSSLSGSAGLPEKPADISYSQHNSVLPVATQKPRSDSWRTWARGAINCLTAPTPTPAPADLTAHQGEDIDPDRPMVALTFDDGPGRGTRPILDLLDQYGGRVTFFIVGSVAERQGELLQAMDARGCEIANHTWSHKALTLLSYQEIVDELVVTSDLIEGAIGKRPTVMRPVGGSYNDNVIAAARDQSMAVVNWSVDTKDWKNRDAQMIYDAVMRDVADGSIVICHDLYESTAQAMERVIPELIAQGYQLVTVSELLSFHSDGMQAGTVYTKR